MNKPELTFNTNVSGTPTTRADFTYKISPTVVFNCRYRIGPMLGD
jgi:hypothetical protein